MELIVRNYGKFLLEAVAFVAFWMLALSNMQGENEILHIWERYVLDESQEYGADFQKCMVESERYSPQISYRYEAMLRTGSYNIQDIFKALDCMGDELQVKVRSISKVNGINTMAAYVDEESVCFQEKGIYRVQLYAVDCWNNETVCDIDVPVN